MVNCNGNKEERRISERIYGNDRRRDVKRRIIGEWLKILVGLTFFAYGVHLTICAGIGLSPWDCLGTGISYHTPLNYGMAMTWMSVLILVIDFLLREKIGFGTIIDALFTGNAAQFFNDHDPFSNKLLPEFADENYLLLTAVLIAGLYFMAFGQYIYMKNGQGCGPRDSLLIGIGKRLPKVPIGVIEILLLAVVLLTGVFLGGPVGSGTIITTFGTGAAMQMVFRGLRFDPRAIRHRSVQEIIAELSGDASGLYNRI